MEGLTTGEKLRSDRRLKPAPSGLAASWRSMKKRSSHAGPTTPPVRRICHGSTQKPDGLAMSGLDPRKTHCTPHHLPPHPLADYLRRVFTLAVSRQTQASPHHGWRCHWVFMVGETMGIYYGPIRALLRKGAVFGEGVDAATGSRAIPIIPISCRDQGLEIALPRSDKTRRETWPSIRKPCANRHLGTYQSAGRNLEPLAEELNNYSAGSKLSRWSTMTSSPGFVGC